MNRILTGILALALAAVPALAAAPALAGDFALKWWSVDCGGAIGTVAGGIYALSGTIGQSDAGPAMNGGAYEVASGFWTGGLMITSDVEEGDANGGTPAGPALAFRASGSAPNPFRERVTMSFELPSRQPVELAIYDPSGRLCRRVQDGELDAGRHSLVWDGLDAEGQSVASGIYFVLLRTPAGQHR